MGKLIILRGNSGSGKTSVAKELQSRSEETHLSYHKILFDGKCCG